MSLENKSMSPEAEFLLFSASRAQVVRELIQPHLERGGIVVCDRFYDSSLAYQGYGHELDQALLRTITNFVTDGLVPDLTFLLDLTSELGLERRKHDGRWNRLDDYDIAFHERVREGYLNLAAAEPDRWVWVDAAQTQDDIQKQIRETIEVRLRT